MGYFPIAISVLGAFNQYHYNIELLKA